MESIFLRENREQIFKKYNQEELERDIKNFLSGSGKLGKLLNHYFEEEMFKCKGGRGNLSPMEALNDDQVVEKILTFTRSKPKFYVGNDIANVKSFFRNAGRTAQKVANFPVKEAFEIYTKYSEIGDTIYDPSCGFGSRLSATLLGNRNYIGTDPNKTLFKKLEECGNFLIEQIQPQQLFNNYFKLYNQGSEILIPEIVGTVDLCFTSPPYFDLEKYGEDSEQSINKYPYYSQWVEYFVKPTIDNCIAYTKSGGHILFNIKNMTSGKKHKLYDAFFDYMSSKTELELVEVMEMNQLSKRDYKGMHFTGVNTDFGVKEPVMVFKRK